MRPAHWLRFAVRFVIATALMLLFSSHYPWYYLWLLPFVSLIPYVPMLYFTTACFYLYTTQLANPGPAMYYMFEWLYATTALLALWCMGLTKRLHVSEELMSESLSVLPQQDMRRYFEKPEDQLSVIMEADPVCLYLETTNRCNLLCTTCPRTFEELEPEKDMSWELFTSIIDQYPKIARVVLHGVGEPMLVKELPRMIRYLKDRGVYVLFNTNGTLLTKSQWAGPDRRRPRRIAGLARCRGVLCLPDGARQRHVRPHRDQRGQLRRHAARQQYPVAACFPLAYRLAGDVGATGGLHPPGPSPGCDGGLSAEDGVSPRRAGTGAAGISIV